VERQRSMNDEGDLAAGDFSAWMIEIQAARRGERGSDVPCGSCTACCTASQFIHIGPDETDTLARVPKALLFPAPRLPRGHVVLGYNERGHCPMLVDDKCSIYEHRPKTCRTYDCRVFSAAGVEPDGDDKGLIARQARRWRFDFSSDDDQTAHEAVHAAATFVRDRDEVLPDGASAPSATQLALLAIELHDLFIRRDAATNAMTVVTPDPAAVRVELTRRRRSGPARQ
jgi:uncharacterized protein